MTETLKLLRFLRQHRQVRWKEVADAGFDANLLYHLLERGDIERIGHGLYRVPDAVVSEHETLVEVAHLVPHGVIALLSSLAFHGIGTQMPHTVWIALNHRETRSRPRIRHTSVEFVWFSGRAFTEGQEVHEIEGTTVRVYSAAKTTADLFKYRTKLGMDVALEALREGLADRRFTPAEVEHFARICRVWAVMKPYLQGMTA
ncbi:MAG: type IV toxin-antitoxin system AbiEi family antitoxin domain-containing protein [Gemmatimonadota bacterium]